MDTTVVKGLAVLEALARASAPMRLSALAEQLGLQKSNVHRLLSTLMAQGFVEQEGETGRYGLTLKIWELGTAVLAVNPVKRRATPYMQDLHQLTGETVSLTILDGDDVLYLDKIFSPRPLRFMTRSGSRALAITTAAGKAMLAYTDDAAAIIDRSIATLVGRPVQDARALMAELEQIREQGYATGTGNWTPGIVSIAGAIIDPDGRSGAALTVSGPAERISESKRKAIIEAVMNVCAQMAQSYGMQ
jgi:IclR family transcriptional regulator, KDG regulon repressor